MPDNVLSGGIWTRAASHWLIKDRAAPWWVIVTTAFGLTAIFANYLPILLYVTLNSMGKLPLDSAMPISYENISTMLNVSGDLTLVLLAYGAIAYLVDWYVPWQLRKKEGQIPPEAKTMPKKGDDAWL